MRAGRRQTGRRLVLMARASAPPAEPGFSRTFLPATRVWKLNRRRAGWEAQVLPAWPRRRRLEGEP